jgi:hypothetical protein
MSDLSPNGHSISFLSYKIVEVFLHMFENTGLLLNNTGLNSKWSYVINFTDMLYDMIGDLYFIPLTMKVVLLRVDKSTPERTHDSPYLAAHSTIMGTFKYSQDETAEEELDRDIKEMLISNQAYYILFPYLSSTINNLLVSSGFGGFTVPLINVEKFTRGKRPKTVKLNDNTYMM